MFSNRKGPGRKRGGKGKPSKECICPECKTVVAHKRGKPCYQHKCPKCGSQMMGRF